MIVDSKMLLLTNFTSPPYSKAICSRMDSKNLGSQGPSPGPQERTLRHDFLAE